MKTNFAYIDAVAQRRLDPDSTRVELENVAGFTVPVEKKNTPGAVESFSRNRAALVSELEKLGVTPLAVLPAHWWERICAASGLKTVDNPSSGQISVDHKAAAATVSFRMSLFSSLLQATLFLAASVAFGTAGAALASPYGLTVAVFAMGLCAIAAVMAFLSIFVTPFRSMVMVISRVMFSFRSVREKYLRALLEPVNSGSGYYRAIPLRLPEPPQDVIETLRKLNGKMRMSVAATIDAFSLPSPVHEYAANDVMQLEQERREELRRQLLADPIVFVRRDNVVAIVAQFGDFPVEKEIVDSVSEHWGM